MTKAPRTMAEINARMGEVGLELAKYRIAPHPNQRALSAELDALRAEYLIAEARESEEATIERLVAEREQAAAAAARQQRITENAEARFNARAGK